MKSDSLEPKSSRKAFVVGFTVLLLILGIVFFKNKVQQKAPSESSATLGIDETNIPVKKPPTPALGQQPPQPKPSVPSSPGQPSPNEVLLDSEDPRYSLAIKEYLKFQPAALKNRIKVYSHQSLNEKMFVHLKIDGARVLMSEARLEKKTGSEAFKLISDPFEKLPENLPLFPNIDIGQIKNQSLENLNAQGLKVNKIHFLQNAWEAGFGRPIRPLTQFRASILEPGTTLPTSYFVWVDPTTGEPLRRTPTRRH